MQFESSRCAGVFVCVLGVCLISAGCARHTVPVEGGRSRATVVLKEDACRSIVAATDELVAYMEKISGARPAVAHSPGHVATPVTIWVGFHDELAAVFPDVDTDLKNWEEILIACRGDNLLIMGRDHAPGGRIQQAGTSLAVYEFIERYLGVRWLWPGELGEDVPENPTITFKDFTYRHVPPRQRWLRMSNHLRTAGAYRGPLGREEVEAISRGKDSLAADWQRRQRGSVYYRIMRAGHAFTKWYELYGKEHPEYFALQPDGSRDVFPPQPAGYPDGDRAKLCKANPDVHERWLELATDILEGDPVAVVVSASPNDSAYSGICVCENCRAWDVAGGALYTYRWRGHSEEAPAITDRMVMFWSILARGLKQRLPDREAFVGSWAYGPYRTPPVEQRLENNIMIGFVGALPGDAEGAARGMEDLGGGRQADRLLWQGWAEKCDHLFWRPNLFHNHWGTPVLFARRSGEDFEFMAERKLSGMDVDSVMNHWSTQGLQYYLLAQLAWNPRQDAEALVDDYVLRAFGPAAAGTMRQYFDAMENAFYELKETIRGMQKYAYVSLLPDVFDPGFLNGMETLLAKALAAADTPLHRQRVDFIGAGLEFTRAQMEVIKAMEALRLGRGDVVEVITKAIQTTDSRDEILLGQLESFALNTTLLSSRTTYEGRGMTPYLGPVSEEHRMYTQVEDWRMVLPAQWRFRLDPEGIGAAQQWYAPGKLSDPGWGAILVTSVWGEQLLSEDPDDPGRLEYHGVAWYHTPFQVETMPREGERLWLVFGRVDESCWVYLNGKLIGEQIYDSGEDPDAWRKPRRFDITDGVKEGANDLVVKVRALAGQGGIAKPVRIERLPANLVPNGYFGQGEANWRVRLFHENYTGLEQRFSRSFALGRYVGEQSMVINIEQVGGEKDNGVYAILEQTVRQPLREGVTYEIRVRFRQTAGRNVKPEGPLMNVRLYGHGEFEAEGKDRYWLRSDIRDSEDWDGLSAMFKAPRDYSHFGITLFFRYPANYRIDEVIVRPRDT